MNELKARIERLNAEKESVEQQLRDAYAESLAAPDSEKAVPDWHAEMMSEPGMRFIRYPAIVNGIEPGSAKPLRESFRKDKWVAVQPCDPECAGKTFLGVLLGDLATRASCLLSKEGVLTVGLMGHNPAIYVPDLHRVIYGMGSWWRPIRTPEHLQEISKSDIENVWYVRALRELSEAQTAEVKR